MRQNKYDYYHKISPQMQKVVDYIKKWNAEHPATEDYRQDYIDERVFWNQGGPQPAKVAEFAVPGGPVKDVPVRIHYPVVPAEGEKLPILVFIHGGGFYLGNNDTHSRVMRILCEKTGCAVIGVDYTLVPDAMFPVQIEECVAVIRYFREHGAEFGLDGSDISLAGDSGGATFCFASTLWIRDKYHDELDCLTSLLLFYGYFGMRDGVSARLFGNEIDGLDMDDSQPYDPNYLSEEAYKGPYNDMLMHSDLTYDIPPCFIACGDCDPLLDNSTLLYEMLNDKGFTCEYKVYPGVMHAYLHYSRMLDAAYDTMEDGAVFLKRARTIKKGK